MTVVGKSGSFSDTPTAGEQLSQLELLTSSGLRYGE